MSAIKAIVGWTFRNALLFALIVAALVAHSVWVQSTAENSAQLEADLAEVQRLAGAERSARDARAKLEADAAKASADLAAYEEKAAKASLAQLRAWHDEAVQDREAFRRQLPSDVERLRHVISMDVEAMAQRSYVELQIDRLDRQIAFLDQSMDVTRDRGALAGRLANARKALQDNLVELSAAEDSCNAKTREWKDYRDHWWSYRFKLAGKKKLDDLRDDKEVACKLFDAQENLVAASRGAVRDIEDAIAAGDAAIDAGITASTKLLDEAEAEAVRKREELASARQVAESELYEFSERHQLAQTVRNALLILLGIIATPFLIRTLFYHVLAPLAARRPSIRIAIPGLSAAPDPIAEPSRVSIPIRLEHGEEVLIRQDYLQTSAVEGEKATRWLLDYRHPLSSLASGLSFLTRIRGKGTSTVSAVRDPFAELTEIALPENSACVIHPRALVAVVQPIGRTMRITSHWRLFNLNAWLTMQLRFFVFHGPGRVVVKGGRGVRVERAEKGRIFGQDQLVGFSADLSYSVTRTETFAPYLFGREQLLKDKVQDSGGILIIEEAPLAGRSGSEVRRGLEGAFDAGMKAFGL